MSTHTILRIDASARKNGSISRDRSGLGLTIAHDVAAAHDGALTLENREGGGACVCLSF